MNNMPNRSWLSFAALLPFAGVGCVQDSEIVAVNTAPSASILSPDAVDGAGPPAYNQGHTVEFVGSVTDAESPASDLKVRWSAMVDGREVELGMSTPDASGRVSLSSAELPAGLNSVILQVWDDDEATAQDTVVVQILESEEPPRADITSPDSGTTIEVGDAIRLVGSVTDPNQSPETLDVEWSSNIDGVLGNDVPNANGSTGVIARLSAGVHTLTLKAWDDAGQVDADFVVLTVHADNMPPQISCDSPLDGSQWEVGDKSLVFRCSVTDDDTRSDQIDVSFTSDVDGQMGAVQNPDSSGDLAFPYGELSAGQHEVTISAMDAEGVVGELTLRLSLVNCADIDVDGDGYSAPGDACGVDDCNDADAQVKPNAAELCDSVDNDCDGVVDDGVSSAFFADADADGYGDVANRVDACAAPTGFVADSTDCNDSVKAVNPAAAEVCDSIDNDCDAQIDEAVTTTFHPDLDSDGYGDAASAVEACAAPAGYVLDATDCNDAAATVFPGNAEVCDSLDNNCNGVADDNPADPITFYKDADVDGFGNASLTAEGCVAPAGYVENGSDCNDVNAAINPNAAEVCDAFDNDCDATIDEGVTVRFYADTDGDYYGDPAVSVEGCLEPAGYVADAADCNDADVAINPAADEVCDAIDNNCNALVDDEPVDGLTYFEDADADGFGNPDSTIRACSEPAGFVTNAEDCLDTDAFEPAIVDAASASDVPDGSFAAPFSRVQDGIDAAQYCVRVYGGTYGETIDFRGKDLEVRGIDGAQATVIDAMGQGSVVTFQAGETSAAKLEGFTLTGGTGTEELTTTSWSCGSSATCYTHIYRYYGGGILIDGASPTLADLVVTGNVLPAYTWEQVDDSQEKFVYSYGGGAFVNDAAVSMTGVDLLDNFADQGGAFYGSTKADVSFEQGEVSQNSAADGAAFHLSGGKLELANALVTSNVAAGDGGALLVHSGEASLANVTLADNAANSAGGVGVIVGGKLTLVNGIVAGSTTGEGLYAESGTLVSIQYSDVYGNAGGEFGGSIADPTGTYGNISEDPIFADGAYTLSASSPCVDAGDPTAAWRDADGSRADMGAFGGPNGAW